jgi:hypothetical protein
VSYLILGFTGRRGHGKNTAAKQLGGAEFSFAAELKRTAKRWYGLSEAQVNGSLEDKETVDPRWGITPREIMQKLGTEVAREIHPDTWLRFTLDQEIPPAMARSGNRIACITDVRFRDECEAIQARGGRVLRIVNPRLEVGGVFSQHASEIEIDELPVDAEIINDGSIWELRNKVLWATREWRGA